jgi:hypothetical protein
MAQVMAKHLLSPPPFEELPDFLPCVVSLLAHMLEKDPARRPISPARLVEKIERCIAAVKGEEAQIAPINLTAQSPMAAPEKMSAAQAPAAAMPARQFFLAEALIGASIAVIIYLILSRPVEPPPAAGPAESAIPSAPAVAAAQVQGGAQR